MGIFDFGLTIERIHESTRIGTNQIRIRVYSREFVDKFLLCVSAVKHSSPANPHELSPIRDQIRVYSREFMDRYLLCVLCGSVVNFSLMPEQTNHEAHQQIRPGAKAT